MPSEPIEDASVQTFPLELEPTIPLGGMAQDDIFELPEWSAPLEGGA